MTNVFKLHNSDVNADQNTRAVYRLAQMVGRISLSGVTAITDNSTGTVSPTRSINALSETLVDVPNASTNLAGKATTDTALASIQTAFATLFARTNAFATTLGLPTVVYNGGGTSGGNTLGAVTTAVTASATGATAAELNFTFDQFNKAFATIAQKVNEICRATANSELVINISEIPLATVPVFDVDSGTAAANAVTKVALDAQLAVAANNTATIAARLNACRAGLGNLNIVVQ